MMYPIHIALILLTIWLIGRKQPDKIWFFIGVILKLVAGIALGKLYLHYYGGGDTFQYFEAAKELTQGSLMDWWLKIRAIEIGHFPNQPRAILFTKIVSGFILLAKGDYWIVSLYFSLVSFLAYWFFYRQIKTTLPNLKWPVIIGFLLLPSTIFWSAGILKGTLTNASVVFLAAMCLKFFFKKKIYSTDIFLSALALVLLLYIKYYILIILSPLIVYAIFDIRAHKYGITPQVRASVYVVLMILTLFIAPSINPNLNVADLPISIAENQDTFHPNLTIPIEIEPTWSSLLTTLPKSLWIGLFSPTILDAGKAVGLIPRAENLFILLFSALSLFLLVKKRLFQPDILVIASVIFILLLAAILPLAAPNYGALIRYRAPFTPFFVMLVTILPTWWLQEKLNR